MYLGICLYAPTLALDAVTPLSLWVYIPLLGVIVTLYSAVVCRIRIVVNEVNVKKINLILLQSNDTHLKRSSLDVIGYEKVPIISKSSSLLLI